MSNKTIVENNNNEDVKITEEDSSVAEFTKRRVPTEQEEEEFEKYVEEENKDEEIEESLNEIYHDDKGNMVDVKKLEIKRGRGFIFRFFRLLFLLGVIAAAAYGAYYYFFIRPGSDITAVDFRIEALLISQRRGIYVFINISQCQQFCDQQRPH